MVRKPKEFIGNHGHRFISEKDERVYFTSSQRLASDLGELLVKIGKRPSYWIASKKELKAYSEMEPIKQMQTVTEYQNVTVKLLRYSIKCLLIIVILFMI